MSTERRTAVITGATGGLGSVLAEDLAAASMNLALLDIDAERISSLAKRLSIPDSRLFLRTVNLLDPSETRLVAQAIKDYFGKIDILLHAVGGWTGGKTLVEASSQDLTFMVNQHIWTSFNAIQAFTPYLIENGWGRIVMITSPYASRPMAGGGPYAIGKAGQETLMLTLSQELKSTGVTANMIQVKTIDIKREKITSPTGEHSSWTTPEEISATVKYLISDQAAMLNGVKIPVYGSY